MIKFTIPPRLDPHGCEFVLSTETVVLA